MTERLQKRAGGMTFLQALREFGVEVTEADAADSTLARSPPP